MDTRKIEATQPFGTILYYWPALLRRGLCLAPHETARNQ